MSWYRTYRPRQVKDLQLESVRLTLLSMMEEANIPQALLFAGPKGTGKTSASRILAALLNDEKNADAVDRLFLQPTSKEKRIAFVEPDPDSIMTKRICFGQSFAVQEIDAASHGLVDDIRQLKERASLLPQEGKMAVYILDEVHMMSGAAFNAFLKLLEEPPAHCVFILATTELHKIPATIASRCALVQFQKASLSELSKTLVRILDSEKVQYKLEQLAPIIEAADGSFRDGVKLLELSINQNRLDDALIERITGGSVQQQLKNIIAAVIKKDEKQVMQLIATLRSSNTDQSKAYRSLFGMLHADLLIGLKVVPGDADRPVAINQFLLQQLLAANLFQTSPISLLTLEIALLDLISRAKLKAGSQGQVVSKEKLKKVIEVQDEDEDELTPDDAFAESQANAVLVAEIDLAAEELVVQPITCTQSESQIDPKDLIARWQQFVSAVALKNSGLAALLRSSQPSALSENALTIGVYYKFHQEQLQQPKFLTILEACCREVAGGILPFTFQLSESNTKLPSSGLVTETLSVEAVSAAPPQTQVRGELAVMASEVLL